MYLLISYDFQNEQRFYPATALKATENGDINDLMCGKNAYGGGERCAQGSRGETGGYLTKKK